MFFPSLRSHTYVSKDREGTVLGRLACIPYLPPISPFPFSLIPLNTVSFFPSLRSYIHRHFFSFLLYFSFFLFPSRFPLFISFLSFPHTSVPPPLFFYHSVSVRVREWVSESFFTFSLLSNTLRPWPLSHGCRRSRFKVIFSRFEVSSQVTRPTLVDSGSNSEENILKERAKEYSSMFFF